ncbi:Rtf2 RING-finger-domain-containing protein [Delphinella strobiligena]|nr:Rtf2 RING-finger-domain-containing protein [Delphinella strobiligena]
MGNDGGSIPTRRELVKEATRNPTTTELKATQTESQSHNWSHDPLTRKPLQKPIVSDSNGKLYNKDSILEFLISGSVSDGVSASEAEKVTLGAIKSLKDVVEVKFDIETEARDGEAEGWKCPITGAKLGPGSKAVYVVPCGHAFSGIAIKEVLAAAAAAVAGTASGEAEVEKCLVCDEGFAPNDVVPILPIREEDIARLQIRSKRLREKGLTHSLKKAVKEKKDKKRKKGVIEETTAQEEEGEAVPQLVHAKGSSDPSSTPRTDTPDPTNTSRINNTSTASLTAKVLAEQATRNKKRRLENDNLKTLFSSRDPSKPHGRSGDFMTRGFDIPAGAKR